MKKEIISFRSNISALDDTSFKERIKDNGVIEELRIRFNPGCQNTLLVNPYVSHKIKKREDLITFAEGTQTFISGDNDYFVFPVYIPVEYDDDLIVECQSIDTLYDHMLAIDIVISYEGSYN